MSDVLTRETMPPGDYAIVELFGHTKLVGRVGEADKFGTRMLVVEPLFMKQLLPPVMQGGASIYRFTPCSAEVAFDTHPHGDWGLPGAIRATVPPPALPAPAEPLVFNEAGFLGERPGVELGLPTLGDEEEHH